MQGLNYMQSALVDMWENHLDQFTNPLNKKAWMTETSGYADTWENSVKPDALALAQDISAALFYGNLSTWVWWQGSKLGGISDYSLMKGTTTGKKYHVSNQFYRYIRPGAVRVKSSTTDAELMVSAFENTTINSHTIVIINPSSSAKSISFGGNNLPAEFTMYRTSSTENCINIGTVNSNSYFNIPAKSAVTLIAGIDQLGTSLSNSTTNVSIRAYPNPASEQIYIDCNLEKIRALN